MKIQNFNEYKLCNTPFCNKEYTDTFKFVIDGFEFNVNLCEEHYNQLEDKTMKQMEGIYGC